MPKHSWHTRVWRMAVTYKVVTIGLSLAGAGILLLFVAAGMSVEKWGSAPVEVLKSLGGTLCATATLALVWELGARRSFTRELLTYIEMGEDLEEAGILRVSWKYLTAADWQGLFANTRELDLFLSYGQTWRNTYNTDLEKLAARAGVRIRVINPDPTDTPTMAELSRRFALSVEIVVERIKESDQYFAQLSTANPNGATIERYFVASCPLLGIYRFSDQAVLTLYSHQRRRTDVPTMLVEAGKPLYKYLEVEFESLRGRATLLVPPQPAALTPAAAPAQNQPAPVPAQAAAPDLNTAP